MSLHYERLQGEFERMLAGGIRDMKDPRISKMTTVTRAELAKDLKTAKVFVSVYDEDDARRQETVEVLNHAQAALGRNVNNHMRLRRIPKMRFILDTGIEQSVHIGKMLDALNITPEQEPVEETGLEDGVTE